MKGKAYVMSEMRAFTWGFARAAHARQIGKDGKSYTEHVWRVMIRTEEKLSRLAPAAIDSEEHEAILCAALLHDVLEDTFFTIEDIERVFPPRVVRLVQGLTRPLGSTYQEWIERIAASGDLGLILIKLADNEDNADPARIMTLPEQERSIARRYERSMRTLRAVLDKNSTI